MLNKENALLAAKNGTADRVKGGLVTSLIRRRYTLSEELSLLRQREERPEEFAAYNAYAETCKAEARELLTLWGVTV